MRFKAVALFSLLGLAACEQILGIDKYQQCDPVCDAAIDHEAGNDASDASADVFQLPDGVSEASSWPKWRVPNTDFEVLNGAPDASAPDVSTAEGGVLDNLTGLVWIEPIGPADTIEAAAAYCSTHGARLPSRIEMATLLDSTRQTPPYIIAPLVNAVNAAKLQKGFLWTSSYVRPIGTQLEFWFAVMSSGDMQHSIAGPGGVLCVR